MKLLPRTAITVASTMLVGCTTFGATRSAEVTAGPAASLQLALTSPLGEKPGWFWSYDCASSCGHSILAPELAFTWGLIEPGSTPMEISLGISGVYPFIDLYRQVGRGDRPWGAGGRVGSVGSWHELEVYGRYDAPAGERRRFLWNPALYLFAGNSPNGANPGHLFATIQSFGLEARGSRVTVIPSASIVVGRGSRSSYGERTGAFNAVFGIVSIRLTVHRRRPDDGRQSAAPRPRSATGSTSSSRSPPTSPKSSVRIGNGIVMPAASKAFLMAMIASLRADR